MSDDFDPETQAPKESSEVELEALLKSLRTEHRRIDSEIKALIETGVADMLKVQRMKKIKLSLKYTSPGLHALKFAPEYLRPHMAQHPKLL